jgi:hypothetical protein
MIHSSYLEVVIGRLALEVRLAEATQKQTGREFMREP